MKPLDDQPVTALGEPMASGAHITTPRPRVLVVDDGVTYAMVVGERLPELELIAPSHGETRLPDGPAALEYLTEHAARVDLVLLDMRFDVPEERLLPVAGVAGIRKRRRYQGVAILHAIRERFPRMPVVLLTAEQDLSPVDADGSLGGQSMTYFLDGDDLSSLRISIHRALAAGRLTLEEDDLLWGRDRGMAALRRRLSVLSRGRTPVIIEGETGTGKSYLAERFVHRKSDRSGPFVVLDLSTVPAELVSAHLFGATKGAYTGAVADRQGVFEAAHRGTLFIDEIQNAPLDVQKQLLLVLQEGRVRRLGATRDIEVDVKVVVASNRPLSEAVSEGRFRADLHMRLSPATRVVVPPLRDRLDDLAFYASRFVSLAGGDPDLSGLRMEIARAAGLADDAPLRLRMGRQRDREDAESADAGSASGVRAAQGPDSAAGALVLELSQPSWERLLEHRWAGNVRELRMVMHNLVSFTLVEAVDALQAGIPIASRRLQIDPGLVDELLGVSTPHQSVLPPAAPVPATGEASATGGAGTTSPEADGVFVRVSPATTLNAVAQDVERQYLLSLFRTHNGDFGALADLLLGDSSRGRAVRLRFNQLGLKVRELRRT